MTEKRTDLKIPYGVSRFTTIRNEGLYYVDKTAYIAKVEATDRFVFFVRPRRFGKSLLVDTLATYYDVNEACKFEKYFNGLWIGEHPTEERNKYLVLTLDFSKVNIGSSGTTLEDRFVAYMTTRLIDFVERYSDRFGDAFVAEMKQKPQIQRIVDMAKQKGLSLYLIIDEYDNFTNQIIRSYGNGEYKSITHGTGFYREWFKTFKGAFDRIFMTGVSPITMDDLTSGFNIARNISQEGAFNAMIGFTREETERLYRDFKGVGLFVNDIERHLKTVERWYDGYCFAEDKIGVERVFNSDMALYYLHDLVFTGKPPRNLVDGNIRSDWGKLKTILDVQRAAEFEGVLPLTEELADNDSVSFSLVESFPIDHILEEANFKSLYYYYGIVTMAAKKRGNVQFRVPNECVRRQVFDYMRAQYAKHGNTVSLSDYVSRFDAFAWDGDWKSFLSYLAERYKATGSIRDSIHGEPHLNGFLRSYLTIKSGYLVKPEMESGEGYSDYALFPDPSLDADSRPEQSYIIELKHSKSDASQEELDRKHEEAVQQLRRYAADPATKSLCAGTPLHLIAYEFKGRELVRLEEVGYDI